MFKLAVALFQDSGIFFRILDLFFRVMVRVKVRVMVRVKVRVRVSSSPSPSRILENLSSKSVCDKEWIKNATENSIILE